MSTLKRAYLLLYNSAQVYGWLFMLVQCLLAFQRSYHSGSLVPLTKIYSACDWYLLVFQTAAILEIFHAMFGIVKANPVLTGFQVFSRLFVTWGIVYSVRQTQSHYSVLICVFAWSLTEVIRYSYYAFSLFNAAPYFLTWCRYTFFIVLYPIGVVGELWSVFFSLSFSATLFRLALPNKLNVSFYYPYLLLVCMVTYIPVFPQLYLHMFAQRRKLLGSGEKKTGEHTE